MILIGIDPGRHIGLAVYDTREQRLLVCETHGGDSDEPIWTICAFRDGGWPSVTVYVEDPAANKPVFQRPGVNNRGMLRIAQNVGANKEAARSLIERLKALGIDVVPVAPRRAKKMDAATFKRLTGWTGRTSQHARDAAALVLREVGR